MSKALLFVTASEWKQPTCISPLQRLIHCSRATERSTVKEGKTRCYFQYHRGRVKEKKPDTTEHTVCDFISVEIKPGKTSLRQSSQDKEQLWKCGL